MHESTFTNQVVSATEPLDLEPVRLRGPVPADLLTNDPLAMVVGSSTHKDLMIYQVINAAWPATTLADPDIKDDAAQEIDAWRALLPRLPSVDLADLGLPPNAWLKDGG